MDSIKSMWSPKLYGMAPAGSLTGIMYIIMCILYKQLSPKSGYPRGQYSIESKPQWTSPVGGMAVGGQ
jgi:hypothetical protein